MRSWFLPLIVIIAFAAVVFVGSEFRRSGPLPQEALLVIDFGNGKKRAFSSEVLPDMDARVVLMAVEREAGVKVLFDSQSGEVRAVDGINGKWFFEKDGANLSLPAKAIKLEAGDRLVLRLLP